jgi:hypothetical protein
LVAAQQGGPLPAAEEALALNPAREQAPDRDVAKRLLQLVYAFAAGQPRDLRLRGGVSRATGRIALPAGQEAISFVPATQPFRQADLLNRRNQAPMFKRILTAGD